MTDKISRSKAGKVYLIGAGPGDPELLTLKAARVRGGCRSTPQAFIEKLMIRYARRSSPAVLVIGDVARHARIAAESSAQRAA